MNAALAVGSTAHAQTEIWHKLTRVLVVASVIVSSGCTTVDVSDTLDRVNTRSGVFTQGNLALARSERQRNEMREQADEILARPLSRASTVQLALLNSPALQAMLAESWEQAETLAQSGRIPNPVFAFEHLSSDSELELTRMLSVGLLDILTLPRRAGLARKDIAYNEMQLTADVIAKVSEVRQAWVRAVVAGQLSGYDQQVLANARASAELARRMEKVGNFNRLARLRQQSFYADAATSFATAKHSAVAAREELVRLLGLTAQQAERMVLPERLPDLPDKPKQSSDIEIAAMDGRIDVAMAQASLKRVSKAEGHDLFTGLTDFEATAIDQRIKDDGESSEADGYELSIELPIFSGFGALRDQLNARTLAAVNRLDAVTREASSSLRQSYSAYRTAYDVADHYRNEIVPLRQSISEEMQLEYNGMLIGVFELLADRRSQVESVISAINAEQQFWLADAALQATVVGQPTMSTVGSVALGNERDDAGGH